MDDQDPRLEGERVTYPSADSVIGRTSRDAEPVTSVQAPDLPTTGPTSATGSGSSSTAASDDGGEPRLQRLQEEVAEARGEVASTLRAIEDRLRPSSLAASAAEVVTDKAAALGDSVATSPPARYARANPWGAALALTGAALAAWFMARPRRRRPRMRDRVDQRPAGAHEFTRTHYDAGAEHALESGATRVPGASPAVKSGVTHSRTEEDTNDTHR